MKTGTIQHQDRFLDTIAENLGRPRRTEKVTLPRWRKQPQLHVYKDENREQLVERLREQCTRIHTDFSLVQLEELSEHLAKTIEEMNGERLIYWKDERFAHFQLTELFQQLEDDGKSLHEWEADREKANIVFAEKADIGITFSDVTLAESGTVVLLSHADKGRSVSLLPTNYIAIIPKSTIVRRLTQATDQLHELAQASGTFPSCVNFISGPSNSADIEMNLVVGVHGPIRAAYIVIEDC